MIFLGPGFSYSATETYALRGTAMIEIGYYGCQSYISTVKKKFYIEYDQGGI